MTTTQVQYARDKPVQCHVFVSSWSFLKKLEQTIGLFVALMQFALPRTSSIRIKTQRKNPSKDYRQCMSAIFLHLVQVNINPTCLYKSALVSSVVSELRVKMTSSSAAVGSSIEEELKDYGTRLITPPHSIEDLLNLLDKVEFLLMKVGQAPSDSMKDALLPVMRALVESELLKHPDVDVKVSVVSCASELCRITAPQQPYIDGVMKEIFQIIVRAFEELSHSGRRYYKAVQILETVADIKACVVLLDLKCDALVIEIFELFLRIIRTDHPNVVFRNMEQIMTLLIEESDEISMELLQPLLDSVKKGNQIGSPISSKLGENVLKECASTIKPYLVEALKSTSMNLDDYAEIVASICNEMPGVEQTATKLPIGDDNLSSKLDKTKRRRKLAMGKNEDSKRCHITKSYGEELVGARIRVWWPLDKMFYKGSISLFDPVTKKHEVSYDDGEVEHLNLRKERWEIVEDNPSEMDLASSALSSVPSTKKKAKRTSSTKRKPRVFSSKRSKRNAKKRDIESMVIPIPDKMNDATDVGCQMSSGKEDLVVKEDNKITEEQRSKTFEVALEGSPTQGYLQCCQKLSTGALESSMTEEAKM